MKQMKRALKVSVIVALVTVCYEMGAQDTQPVNGQVISPNGIEMVYVEGQGDIKGFYIGKYEVTHQVWKAVMGSARTNNAQDDWPVVQTSWLDMQVFIKRLNELTGRTYRLPTQAEWVFAAKGGTLSKGYRYSGSNNIDEVAWYQKNNPNRYNSLDPQPVGGKKPNELGIYDMTGNVGEMLEDWYNNKQKHRVWRGGNMTSSANASRIEKAIGLLTPDSRNAYYVGFRLVLEP